MGREAVRYVRLWGCLGRLSSVGGAPTEAHACFVWRTDQQLLGCKRLPGATSSLHELACDMAELYHRGLSVQVQGSTSTALLPWTQLKVIWLELVDDGALLVFLKPATEHRSDHAKNEWPATPA